MKHYHAISSTTEGMTHTSHTLFSPLEDSIIQLLISRTVSNLSIDGESSDDLEENHKNGEMSCNEIDLKERYMAMANCTMQFQ